MGILYNSFTYNGFTLGEGSDYTIDSVTGLDMDRDVQTQRAPYQDGTTFIASYHKPRIVTLEGGINITDIATLGARRAALASALADQPNSYTSTPQTLKPLGIITPTGTRWIDAEVQRVTWAYKKSTDGFQRFQIQFYCPNPFFYGVEQQVTSWTQKNGGVSIADTYTAPVYVDHLGTWVAMSATYLAKGLGANYGATAHGLTNFTPVAMAYDKTTQKVMVVSSWYPSNKQSYWSTDLVNWNPVNIFPTGRTWTSVRSDDCSTFYLIDIDGAFLAWDDVAGSWTKYTNYLYLTTLGHSGFRDIAINNQTGRLIVCYIGGICYSDDQGATWTDVTTTARTWKKCIYQKTNGLFILFSDGTYTSRSTDATSWTETNTSGMANVGDPVQNGSLTMIATDGSKIHKSTDGATWTAQAISMTGTPAGISYSAEYGVYTILSNTAAIESTDGTTWSNYTGLYRFTSLDLSTMDADAPFVLYIPIVAGATGSYVIVSLDTPYFNGAIPPDNWIKISTEGLPAGVIVIDTKKGQRSIKQFGSSILNKLTGGGFFGIPSEPFTMFVFASQGLPPTAPTLKYTPLFIGAAQ